MHTCNSKIIKGCVAAAISASLAVASPALAHASTVPTATTGAVSALTSSSATASGSVSPNGTPTSSFFRYWVTRAKLMQTATVSDGSGTGATNAQAALAGLLPSTTYSYRVLATSASGLTGGAILTFTTSAAAQQQPPGRPEATPQTAWAPVGAMPLTDAQAAALVTPEPEVRPANAAANDYVPTSTQLAAFYKSTPGFLNDPLRQYVTGRPGISNPSTDDLIQWAAHKWGIPEDWIRAEMVQESDWNQSALGDLTTVSSSWYGLYPPQSRVAGTSNVYESLGVMQCRWPADNSGTGAGTEPLRWESTAFNLDFYGQYVRWLYNGYTVGISWIPNIYKGNQWNSISGWFGGGGNAAAQHYITYVQNDLAARTWAQPGF